MCAKQSDTSQKGLLYQITAILLKPCISILRDFYFCSKSLSLSTVINVDNAVFNRFIFFPKIENLDMNNRDTRFLSDRIVTVLGKYRTENSGLGDIKEVDCYEEVWGCENWSYHG